MASENNVPATGAAWIKASLFEPVLRESVDGYKQTKDFKTNLALAPGENYATVILRIEAEVELKDGSSKTIPLMLKTAHNSEMFADMMQNHNVFEIEAIMYRDVIPEFEQLYKDVGLEVKFGPKSYELNTNMPYILLEDLKPIGFKNTNRLEGLDMEHCEAVLKKLAQWHAASAVRVATKGLYKSNIANSFYGEGSLESTRAMFQGMINAFMQCVGTYEGSELYYERLAEMKDKRLDELFETSKVDLNEFNVLNHGDCWSNNVMFRYDAFGKIEDTYLIDYQLPKYGSPAQDLYYFLLSSTKYELKTKQFDYFIKYYHDKLIEHLKLLNYSKKIPSLKDIHILLHKENPWALCTTTGVLGIVLLDPNADANFDNFLNDTDGGNFKLQLYSNPRYRKHMEMLLPWLYNRGAL